MNFVKNLGHKDWVAIAASFVALAALITTLAVEPATPAPTPTLPELNATDFDTSAWKLHRSERYGFAIRYPRHWQVRERQDLIGTATPLIYLESDTGTTISIFPRGGLDRGLGTPTSQAQLDINGMPALVSEYHLSSTQSDILVIVSILDWFPDNRIEFRSLNQLPIQFQVEEFHAILSTFTIL